MYEYYKTENQFKKLSLYVHNQLCLMNYISVDCYMNNLGTCQGISFSSVFCTFLRKNRNEIICGSN